ncbi:hypothetical protein X770_23510 [Mesorhizobium sp. LSJC269B00]|nr:hypothetical protein X770_23510 [Mesorhizobium sp. LSJC269B00]ESY26364.1 hypothetical protein X751_00615 [Mesorhizobium sp. LNJC395A00]
MAMMHPVIACDDVAWFSLGQDAPLQSLQGGVGQTALQKRRTYVTIRHG